MSIHSTGLRALACLALLLGAGAAHASSFAYNSAAGEPLGGGGGLRTLASPTATFEANGNRSHIMLDIDVAGEHWNIQFRAPNKNGLQTELRRGSYTAAEHAAFATSHAPGLEILGPQGQCLDVYGSFKIRQLDFDFYTGTVDKLEATFTHRCGGATAPLLTGTIYFEARPRSYAYSRGPGSMLGTGTSKSYVGDTSYIGAGGYTSSVDWHVSGQRDDWRFIATAPTDTQFVKGKTYALQAVEDATHAGIAIEWNGAPACPNPTGTLKILNISNFPDMSEVNGLYATYTIYCNGGTDPYKGTIRYEL